MFIQATKYSTAFIDEDNNPQISFDIDDSFNDFYNETFE